MASLYRVVYSTKAHGDKAVNVQATSQANAWAAVVAAYPSSLTGGIQAMQPQSITEYAQSSNILVGS